MAYSLQIVRGFFYVPESTLKGCIEAFYCRYPRKLESLANCDVITKATLSPQLFKDPEY